MVIPMFCLAQSLDNTPKLLYQDTFRISPRISFGWGKSFNDEQMEYYSLAQWHSIVYAEVGEKVKWQSGNAHGYSQVLLLEPKGGGYCKHVRTVVFAYNKKESITMAACYEFWSKRWAWYELE